jgi:hypothetical protein
MGSANTVRVKLKPTLSLLLGLCALCFGAVAVRAGDVTLLGNERIVFSTLFGDSTGVNYPCGRIARTATGWNYNVDNEPFFDGMIAPISYSEGGITKLRFNASLGYRNYEILSTISGFGEGATFSNGTLQCTPVYTGSLDYANDTFAWGEWLYGTFRDVGSGNVYAAIYNEYYGGYYYPGQNSYVYVATGLAISSDNGHTFSKIASAPNHVILRSPDLPQGTDGGYSHWAGIFQSPVDYMYYMGVGGPPTGTSMMRTSNLNDPQSWRAWDGSSFSLPTVPLTGSSQPIGWLEPGVGLHPVVPLYLGYSDYFKKYMAVTLGSSDNYQSGNNLIVYNLSEDLIHWGPPRKIMDNPACGPDHVCGNDVSGEIGSYPSIMDPGYLSDIGDSTKASNGMTGVHPFVTYIKDFVPPYQHRQEFAVQQVSFENVVFNRMDNFSMRGVVDGGGRSLVMGFIMQGTESKQFVFRGIGPSLPNIFSYPTIGNPRISLYDGSGNLVASNLGWRSLSAADQNVLTSTGLNPGSDADSAIVVTIGPGNYTVTMDNGYGMGVIDAFDLSSTAESKIAEVSVRGYGQPADGALTMGFYSRGGQRAIVRGTGTSTLAPFGFSPVIPDPYVTVYDGGGGTIISNDNWWTDPNAGEIQNDGLAPGDGAESATLFTTQTTLPTRFSTYTVQMQGTGYGLLELYNVNAN